MRSIHSCPIPDTALLAEYPRAGAFADCYTTQITGAVSQVQFVTAFYTTWIFKLERWVLRWALAKPSTDAEAAQLAVGSIDAFAAWRVERRGEDQLLLCDVHGRTRSWLMTAQGEDGTSTRLYFGSAVVPVRNANTGTKRMGFVFRVLLGFHRLYSIVLLRAAKSRLLAQLR
jgi:hypothetical protein